MGRGHAAQEARYAAVNRERHGCRLPHASTATLRLLFSYSLQHRRFYTFLPAVPPAHPEARTFIVLPKQETILAEHFIEARNTLAEDEVQAHTGMFDSKTNDGYYELGLVTAQFIRDAVANSREVAASKEQNAGSQPSHAAHTEVPPSSDPPTQAGEPDLLLY